MLFVASFFCCLFVFMMQFTWRSIDELIGKGLTVDVLAEFFWYMGLALIPQALPLAILLAALMTYGNMGQQLELLAMKAAGISLLRAMRPVALVSLVFTGVSFYFQNETSPKAQLKLTTLLLSMKMNSPVLEIPEGTFYNGVPNINLYVEYKDNKTGMLYHMIIYKTDQGFDKAQIVLADSGKLEMTADKKNLRLQLWSGEQFENLQASNMTQMQVSMPYDRETFGYKQFLISFDANFNKADESALSGRPNSKNMSQIQAAVDSMNVYCDSVGNSIYKEMKATGLALNLPQKGTKIKDETAKTGSSKKINFDTVYANMSADAQLSVAQNAASVVQNLRNQLEWEQYDATDTDKMIRRYLNAWHEKFVLALSCLVFFFIAAPLGSIIRNGGFGVSMIIAVAFFILYYLMSTSGMKLAREGSIEPWFGMWFCLFVLTPIAVFLTIKGNNDSFQFNPSAISLRIKRTLGLRIKRYIPMKEVVIETPDYEAEKERLGDLARRCRDFVERERLWKAPNYINAFFRSQSDHPVKDIENSLNSIIENLSNSRDYRVIKGLNDFPVLYVQAHEQVFANKYWNGLCGVLLPLGFILWIRMWRFRLFLLRDMKQLIKACTQEQKYIINLQQTIKHKEENESGL